jgi:hypothetical protein
MGFPRDRFGCTMGAITEEYRHGRDIIQAYEVELPDGRTFTRENYWSAVALTAVQQEIDDVDLKSGDPTLVPVRVAVMGRPAMTAYLMGVHGLSREKTAERLDVQLSSVKEYLREFRYEARYG